MSDREGVVRPVRSDRWTKPDRAWLERFGKRAAVFAAVGPACLACVRAGSPWLDLLATAGGAASAKEVSALLRSTGLASDTRTSAVVASLLVATGPGPAAVVAGVGLAAAALGADRRGPALAERGVALGAAALVGLPLRLVLRLRRQPDGTTWLAWGMATTWLNDAGAYLIGPRMGGPALPPWVNGRKTWLGYLPGVLLSALSGLAGARRLRLSPAAGLALGAALGVGGAVGDMLESVLKRAAKQVDSGAALPGYGGVLDRLDSFLTTMVVLYLVHRTRDGEPA